MNHLPIFETGGNAASRLPLAYWVPLGRTTGGPNIGPYRAISAVVASNFSLDILAGADIRVLLLIYQHLGPISLITYREDQSVVRGQGERK